MSSADSHLVSLLWIPLLRMSESLQKDHGLLSRDSLLVAQRLIGRCLAVRWLVELNDGVETEFSHDFPKNEFSMFLDIEEGGIDKKINHTYFQWFGNSLHNQESLNISIPKGKLCHFEPWVFTTKHGEDIEEIALRIPEECLLNVIHTIDRYSFSLNDIKTQKGSLRVSPSILGRIFEQQGSILRSSAPDFFTTEKQVKDFLELRKNIGVYYTPSFIADYVARKTLSLWILSMDEIPDVNEISILDPTAGAGSFLLSSAPYIHTLLCQNHDKQISRRKIATSCLYGVDMDLGATEVCMVRLALWVYEDSNAENYYGNSLLNIKSGNSLPVPIEDNNYGESTKSSENIIQPFKWEKEYPHIFRREDPGFQILIGNPPFGNILGSQAKEKLAEQSRMHLNEVSVAFMEQEINILASGGCLGNILPGSVIVNTNLNSSRELLQEKFPRVELSYYGTRPTRLFPEAEIRIAILHGYGAKLNKYPGELWTSLGLKFSSKNRKQVFDLISFSRADDLCIDSRLPKVGNEFVRKILKKLLDFERKIWNAEVLGSKTGYKVIFRTTGGYWINALLEFPYKGSSKLVPLFFTTPWERDFAHIVLNSSLFYLFWASYGNLRDVTRSIVRLFPFPQENQLIDIAPQLEKLRKDVESCIWNSFIPSQHEPGKGGRRGELHMSECRHILDQCDRMVGPLYNLSNSEIEYVLSFDKEIRPPAS